MNGTAPAVTMRTPAPTSNSPNASCRPEDGHDRHPRPRRRTALVSPDAKEPSSLRN
ncbi:hypothetical protein YT1_4160 [Rhodococcus ruber]|nr:hypothetical protein YT1_4160 [Rhodococcus ruber]